MKTQTRWITRILWTVGAIAGLVASYAIAGLIGGAIPSNAGWRAPSTGVHIFVESNGVHTGIIVPKVAAGVDWRGVARPEDLSDPRFAGYDHVSFGWGEKTFYLETPTWAEVKLRTVLGAAFGSTRTLMHVDHLPMPRAGDGAREIVVTPAQYRRLAAYIRASFRDGGSRYRGYAGYDAFYDAYGRYSAIHTCNSWTGDALRFAGVRVGWWTPFPVTVTAWF
ncbi:TIGR02117 family protein [Sphingomonas sp. UV9]|uniref:TIGR02117 family protein n=1 Tax=Sphingomonas sp. UV9 TaxID=1851410 RepID=UPI000FFBFB52|nr:TIGR02117 family protein [Sphingomonas sp. UV9]RXD05406.1 TIGR02117 family protein [Sphingomonas sp. UV9]